MIYVVRHGETEWNAINKVLGRATDLPLNEKGMKQAEAAAKQLKNLKPDVFLCSPLLRARQTADAICMIDGAVAQLILSDTYGLEKIPLSNDFALELFFSKGTKAVMPDLIKMFNTGTFAAAETTKSITIGRSATIALSEAIGDVSVTIPAGAGDKLTAKVSEDKSKVKISCLTGLTAGSYNVVLTDSKGSTVTIAVTAAAASN